MIYSRPVNGTIIKTNNLRSYLLPCHERIVSPELAVPSRFLLRCRGTEVVSVFHIRVLFSAREFYFTILLFWLNLNK